MAISKIILNGVTQMDVTGDTVTAATLLSPQTAHGADGEQITGTADVQYKLYNSVTDIGLTSGSATIAGAWSAMPEQGVLIAGAGEFDSSARPSASAWGQIEIVKNSATNGYIEHHGLTDSVGDFRMFLNASNVPSGTWYPIASVPKTATPTASTGTYDTDSYGLIKVGSVVTCSFRVTGASVGTSYTQIATIPDGFRPKKNLNRVPGLANYTPIGLYISTAGNISAQASSALTNQDVIIQASWSTD